LKLSNKIILIISPDAWGKYFLSKHHYALQLSEKNTVYFLNHANHKNGFSINKIKENLFVVDYKTIIPKISLLPFLVRNLIYKNQIKNLNKKLNVKFDVIWSFDSFRFDNLKYFDADLNIFHLVDRYKNGLEKNISESADITFVSSKIILDKISDSKPKYAINHGVANSFFKDEIEEKNFEGKNKIKALYSGNLNHKHINFALLKKLIEKNLKVDFVMLGNYSEDHFFTKFLKQQENVILISAKPFEQLINYYKSADVLLICYDDKILESPPLPHKLFEYLSSGNVVLCNNLSEVEIENPTIIKAKNDEDYLEQFDFIINNLEKLNDINLTEQRVNIAKENSYENQLQKIADKLIQHQLI